MTNTVDVVNGREELYKLYSDPEIQPNLAVRIGFCQKKDTRTMEEKLNEFAESLLRKEANGEAKKVKIKNIVGYLTKKVEKGTTGDKNHLEHLFNRLIKKEFRDKDGKIKHHNDKEAAKQKKITDELLKQTPDYKKGELEKEIAAFQAKKNELFETIIATFRNIPPIAPQALEELVERLGNCKSSLTEEEGLLRDKLVKALNLLISNNYPELTNVDFEIFKNKKIKNLEKKDIPSLLEEGAEKKYFNNATAGELAGIADKYDPQEIRNLHIQIANLDQQIAAKKEERSRLVPPVAAAPKEAAPKLSSNQLQNALKNVTKNDGQVSKNNDAPISKNLDFTEILNSLGANFETASPKRTGATNKSASEKNTSSKKSTSVDNPEFIVSEEEAAMQLQLESLFADQKQKQTTPASPRKSTNIEPQKTANKIETTPAKSEHTIETELTPAVEKEQPKKEVTQPNPAKKEESKPSLFKRFLTKISQPFISIWDFFKKCFSRIKNNNKQQTPEKTQTTAVKS